MLSYTFTWVKIAHFEATKMVIENSSKTDSQEHWFQNLLIQPMNLNDKPSDSITSHN